MKTCRYLMMVAVLGLSYGVSSAAWTAASDYTNYGESDYQVIAGDSDFGGLAVNYHNWTYAQEYGYTWVCGDRDACSLRAYARNTSWTKRWNWTGCPIPWDESIMDITVEMTWRIDGDSNNLWPTAARAKTYAHSQVIINSGPDNAGDYTGEGEWSGDKREGDTFSGGLSLDWDASGPGGTVALSWESDPADLWESGPTTKTNRYLQNIKNKVDDAYDYIAATIGLLSEVEVATDTNAFHASAYTQLEVTHFSLSEPQ